MPAPAAPKMKSPGRGPVRFRSQPLSTVTERIYGRIRVRLPALSAKIGGIVAVDRHYRFGVVAVGTRSGGTIQYVNGVVENPDWIDKVFELRMGTTEGGFGAQLKDQALVFADQTKNGREYGRLQYSPYFNILQGVNLGGFNTTIGKFTWAGWSTISTVDAGSSYSAASPLPDDSFVVLSWLYTVVYESIRRSDNTWSNRTVVFTESNNITSLSLVRQLDDRVRAFYVVQGDPNVYTRLRSTDGKWGARSACFVAGEVSAVLIENGRILLAYTYGSSIYSCIMEPDGSFTNIALVDSSPTNSLGNPSLDVDIYYNVDICYKKFPNGELYNKTRASATGLWGAATLAAANDAVTPSMLLLPDGTKYIQYTTISTGRLNHVSWTSGGGWSAPVEDVAVASSKPALKQFYGGKTLLLYFESGTGVREKVANNTYTGLTSSQKFLPVGAGIVETGYNTNGYWIKFSDGTMICRGRSSSMLSTDTASGGGYISSATYTPTFPQAFIFSVNADIAYIAAIVDVGVNWAWISTSGAKSATSGCTSRISHWNSGVSGYIEYIAMGRWK